MHSEFFSEVNMKLPEMEKKKKKKVIYLNSGSPFHIYIFDLEFNYKQQKLNLLVQ